MNEVALSNQYKIIYNYHVIIPYLQVIIKYFNGLQIQKHKTQRTFHKCNYNSNMHAQRPMRLMLSRPIKRTTNAFRQPGASADGTRIKLIPDKSPRSCRPIEPRLFISIPSITRDAGLNVLSLKRPRNAGSKSPYC